MPGGPNAMPGAPGAPNTIPGGANATPGGAEPLFDAKGQPVKRKRGRPRKNPEKPPGTKRPYKRKKPLPSASTGQEGGDNSVYNFDEDDVDGPAPMRPRPNKPSTGPQTQQQTPQQQNPQQQRPQQMNQQPNQMQQQQMNQQPNQMNKGNGRTNNVL